MIESGCIVTSSKENYPPLKMYLLQPEVPLEKEYQHEIEYDHDIEWEYVPHDPKVNILDDDRKDEWNKGEQYRLRLPGVGFNYVLSNI